MKLEPKTIDDYFEAAASLKDLLLLLSENLKDKQAEILCCLITNIEDETKCIIEQKEEGF